MMGRSKVLCALVLCMLVVGVPSLWAQWIADGVPVCTAAENQEYPNLIPDGAGGAIIVWQDNRAGNRDIYARRVGAGGTVQWTADGIALCTASGNQQAPQLITDGMGGAIAVWYDYRAGNWDIYAQRVSAAGAVQWTANGVVLCADAGSQSLPHLAADGAGGAIVAWRDNRAGNNDIYAQRVNASGVAQWTANGVDVCTAPGSQTIPWLIPDGFGGAIVAWQDNRAGNNDIYAQRVNASGGMLWAKDGVAICTAAGHQYTPRLIPDGSGGAIIVWDDLRSGNWDVYVQRVSAAGAVQWTANGIAICTASGNQNNSRIAYDGLGGAIVVWQDNRAGNLDIYAQRVNGAGAVQWTADGVVVCAAAETQAGPEVVSCGIGGAVVTWEDNLAGNYDIYAQRLSAEGLALWTENGVVLCAAAQFQGYSRIVSDGSGGAIVAWQDNRAGNHDIYVQMIDVSGEIGGCSPGIHSVRDVPGDQGGWVNLWWHASRLEVFGDDQMSHYTLWRAISPERAALAFEGGAEALGSLAELRVDAQQPVIRLERSAGRAFFWEQVARQEALDRPAHGKTVATLFDSSAVCNDYHYFQVVAHTLDPWVFWASRPDSGYSVDNLAPLLPQGFAGEQSFAPAGLVLSWAPNGEADLDGYRIYRGVREDFVPAEDNLLAAVRDTLCFDELWSLGAGYYYRLSALDVNGNESGWALLRPEDIAGRDGPGTPRVSYLAQNYPNPFNPATRIAFELAGPGRVSLRIYDASGRRVRVMTDGERSAGRHEEVWDGCDGSGRAVASGVYFYRLEAGALAWTRKMVLLR